MQTMERIVKGIYIPIEIWQAEDLCWSEKILLMEIDSFTSKGLDCFFSNDHIAKFLKVSEDYASQLVNSLIAKGYVKLTKFDGRHRYLESCIEVRCRVGQKSDAESDKSPGQTLTKVRGSIYNNTNNYTTNNKEKIQKESGSSRFVKPSIQDVRDYCSIRANGIDAETFFDFYESKGWKVGNTPMKDWKAAVRTWERSRNKTPQGRQKESKVDAAMRVLREMGITEDNTPF